MSISKAIYEHLITKKKYNAKYIEAEALKEDIKKRDILMNEQKNTFNTKKAVWEETLKAQEEKIIKLNKQIKKLKEENKWKEKR